jgi:hypothetical protein
MDLEPIFKDYDANFQLDRLIEHTYKRLRPDAGDPRSQYSLVAAVAHNDMKTFRAIPSYELLSIVYGRKPTFYDVAVYEGFRPLNSLYHTTSPTDAIDMEDILIFHEATRRLCDSGLCIDLKVDHIPMIAALGPHRLRQNWSRSEGFKQRFENEAILYLHKLKKLMRMFR